MAQPTETRGAIAVHHTATVDKSWDAGEMTKRVKAAETELKLLYAWRSHDGDPDSKSSYKFPHHEVSGDGQVHAANVKACQSIISVLNGGRGGTDIPDADVPGVYRHAAAHIKDAGLEPAELSRAVEQPRIERRAVTSFRIVRAEGRTPMLAGRAAPYDVETTIGGWFPFKEVLRSGCFKRALAEGQDAVCWYQHGMGSPLPLGRTRSGTLRLTDVPEGLDFECDLPDTQEARDLAVSIERGDIDGMSFAFAPVEENGERWTNGDPPLREVLDADLFDVSPVVFPAYPQTSVGMRSAADVYQRYLDSQKGAGAPSEASEPKVEAGLDVERARIELERTK